jgi:uncharacterized membrane protein YdjX (TVP38/TMEM64 family)
MKEEQPNSGTAGSGAGASLMHGADDAGETAQGGEPSRRAPGLRAALLVRILILVAGVALARWVGIGEQIGALRGWIEGLGSLGPVVYAAIYAGAVVVAVPGSLLSVGAGTLFGAGVGMAVVSVGATTGASLAFLAARYVGREAVVKRFSHKEIFQRLDRMTEDRGAVIVALTRLIPLFPFNLLNYGFGLTRVRFGTYVFWSWLCMSPGIVVYVAGTDVVVQFLMGGRVPGIVLAVLGGGIVVLAVLVRFAQRKLEQQEPGARSQESE